ncbi:MAG: phosphoadenosine phosphosulfate reductase family protein [Desulfohalobiaceae bacterium]|nr:phosphoadenosine phosphosulfate reductase family protein [Desulfohalobiaceae bacterium]
MSGLTLEQKIETSYRCFDQILLEHDAARIQVAWTGGKDSTVVLYLWRRYLLSQGLHGPLPLKGLSLDTGLKFPEVLLFRDELAKSWDVELTVVEPEAEAAALGPDPEDPVNCCRRLKILPLQKAVEELSVSALLTGIRHDEHQSRRAKSRSEVRHRPEYVQVHPVLHWTEMDIWAFHLSEDIPYCGLYDQGYRSLGCRPCTRESRSTERSGRNQDKEARLEMLRSLGYF